MGCISGPDDDSACCCPSRWVFAFMGFASVSVAYILRVDVNLALVGMVNHTALNQIAFQSYQQWIIDHNGSLPDDYPVGSAASCPWPDGTEPPPTVITPTIVSTTSDSSGPSNLTATENVRTFNKIPFFFTHSCFSSLSLYPSLTNSPFLQLNTKFLFQFFMQSIEGFLKNMFN
jgi:hypothetical protein